MADSKRKRIKLECLDCGSVFNNDYKLKHERDVHKGKKIRIKHFSASINPFVAAKEENKQLVCILIFNLKLNVSTRLKKFVRPSQKYVLIFHRPAVKW